MPAIRGSATTTTGTAATVVGTVPVGSVVGDLLVFAMSVDTVVTVTPPAGFNLIKRQADTSSGNDEVMEAYYRLIDGTEAASYKWVISASNDFAGMMVLVSGANGSPHKSNSQPNAAGATVTVPSVTTTVDGCLLMGFFGTDTSPPGTITYSAGTMTTKIVDISTANWANLSVYTETQTSQGATGTRTATASGANTGSMGIMVAFDPVVASGAAFSRLKIRPGPPSGPQQVAWMQRPQLATDIPASSINATFTVTESDDTILSGTTVAVSGSLLVTEASDTILSNSAIASNLSLQVTESSDTILSNTGLGVAGTLVVTETSDTIVSSLTGAIGLSAAITEAADTIVSGSSVAIAASLQVTEASDTIVSGATVASSGINASLAVTESSDSVVSGTVIGVATTLAVAESGDSVLSNAFVTNSGINTSLSVTESDDSVLSGTSLALSGSVAVTEDDDSISSFLDTGNPIVVTTTGPIPGAGRGRKLRILPDGTRLYATEDEVRKILTHFYKPKSLDDVKLLPKKVQQKFKEQPVEIELVQFDKHVPKFYELKTEKRLVQGDYNLFLKALRRKEEEEFLYLVMEML